MDALKNERKQLMEKREELIELRASIQHTERILEEKVDAMYAEAVGSFKHENVSKRQDHTYPDCFKTPHVPLPLINHSENMVENS